MKKYLIISIPIVAILILLYSCGDRKISVSWTPTVITDNLDNDFCLKVYIENSGSMDGYMCDGSELKDAVYGYISTLNSYADTTELNYINSQIISYRGEMKNFIKTMNPQSFSRAGGNRSNSDIADMLEQMLEQTCDSVVSIFVSDCILDIPNGDATKFFENRSIDIRNAVTKYLHKNENLGIEIFHLESTFTGRYYYSNGSEYLKDVKRPYYMWVMGNKDVLAYLNKQVSFDEIKHGVKNYFAFSSGGDIPFSITNKNGIAHKSSSCICTPNPGGGYSLLIKSNLQTTLQDDYILCDINNYETLTSDVCVESVRKITASDSPYTHVISVAVNNNGKPFTERITLKSPLTPLWLEEINDDLGRDIRNNLDKTTGIKYLVQGVADAYKKQQQLGSFKFIVNNH